MRLRSNLHGFLADSRGVANMRVVGAAFAMSFIAVLGAVSLDHASQNGSLARIAGLFGKSAPQYDFAPVGTIPAIATRNVVLDPCLGVPK